MLRPNTELLKEEVNQSVPRFVDVSKGTLTSNEFAIDIISTFNNMSFGKINR